MNPIEQYYDAGGGPGRYALITRYAALRWAAKFDPPLSIDSREMHEQMLATGRQIVPGSGWGFTNSYFAAPAEVCPFMEEGGLETRAVIGCEGIASGLEEGINKLSGDVWDTWVDWMYRVGHDPSLHGAADHLLYVGRKKETE